MVLYVSLSSSVSNSGSTTPPNLYGELFRIYLWFRLQCVLLIQCSKFSYAIPFFRFHAAQKLLPYPLIKEDLLQLVALSIDVST